MRPEHGARSTAYKNRSGSFATNLVLRSCLRVDVFFVLGGFVRWPLMVAIAMAIYATTGAELRATSGAAF